MKKAAVPSILGAVVLLAVAVIAEAQQPKKVPRKGYLEAPPPSAVAARTEAFRQGLRELGYAEGKNIVIEYRYAEGKSERIPALAAELVHLKVDVIVSGGSLLTRAAKEATVTIPIVMAQDIDPVSNGFVASLARPGGNITGLSNACPGDKRKATGASEGDHSQALPRGRPGDFDPTQVTPNSSEKRNSPQRHSQCSFNT